jgi:ABC-2 type transport system permease protein
MTRLLRVEFRRLRSRRLFKLVLLGLLLGMGIPLVLSFVHSNRNLAAAQASAAAQAAANASPPPGLVTLCQKQGTPLTIASPDSSGGGGPVTIGPGSGSKVFRGGPCTYVPPTAADFYSDPRFSFTDHAANDLTIVIAAVALLGFVVGAGFIGAEWAAGTFALLLMWEPRRLRVLGAKLISVIVAFMLIGVVAMAVTLGATWAIAATRGTTAGTTHAVKTVLLYRSLRGLVLVGLLTGAGTALAGLTRHTAMALVAVIGYLIAFEVVLRHIYPDWSRWLLTSNAGAFLTGSERIFPPRRDFVAFGTPTSYLLHANRAAIYLGGLFVVLVALWAVALLRRDVDEGGR